MSSADANAADGSTVSPARRKRIALHAGVLASYFAVAVARTFPLLGRAGKSIPGGHTDVFAFLWNNWWIFHALRHHLSKPYITSAIFAPFKIDLRLHTAGFLYGLLSAPLFPVLGQVGVLNLQVFATVVLNGYAMFTLARQVVRDERIAFVCGLLIAGANAMDFHLQLGRPSCAAVWPAILAIDRLLRLLDEPTPRNGAWAALWIVAMFLVDQQVAMFGCFWLAIVVLDRLLRRSSVLRQARTWLALALPAVAGAVAAYVLFFRPLKYDVGYTVPGASEALGYSRGLELFASPKDLWLTYGTVFPVSALVALALVRRRPEIRSWVLGAWAFLIFTMGPVLHGTNIPLPFALVRHLPGMAHFRTPYRFMIPMVIGAAMATGILLSHVQARAGGKTFRLLLGAVALVAAGDAVGQRLVAGFPIRSAPRPEPVYQAIARDPRDRLVLEVPLAARSGTDRIGRWTDTPGEALTFYQPIHGKRLINGFAARVPETAMPYYRSSPALMFLAEEIPPAGDRVADLRQKLVELDVGYVVVHPDMLQPGGLPGVLQLLDQAGGLERLPDTGDLIAFGRR